MSTVDPQALYESLLATTKNPRKISGLKIIHGICKERFEAKAMDWGVSSIGRESEKRGGPTPASLHQPALEYYRGLIKAWQAHAESTYPAERRRVAVGEEDWIDGIENVAQRQLVRALTSELKHCKARNQVLTRMMEGGGKIQVVMPGALPEQPTAGGKSIVVEARAGREARKFNELLGSKDGLAEMGLVVSSGDLVSNATGEILLSKALLDLLHSAANLA